jgi:signal transduction histidine kinase
VKALRQFFFPPTERALGIREEMARQARVSARVVGAMGMILAVTGVSEVLVVMTWRIDVFPLDSAPVALQSQVGIAAASVVLLAASRRRWHANVFRSLVGVFGVVLVGLVLRTPTVVESSLAAAPVVFTYILLLAVTPFRPLHALLFGLVLTTEFWLVAFAVGATEVQRSMAALSPIVTAEILSGTVLAGVLYTGRRRLASHSVEAAQLRRRLEAVATVAEISPVPTVRIRCQPSGEQGAVIWSNPAAQTLASELQVPDLSTLVPEGLGERGRAGRTLHETHDRVLQVSYGPLESEDELVVALHDITEREFAHAKAIEYAEELEDRNRELQRTQLQLVQSEKMASLGNLVAGIAHEINTPLGAIRASGETMKAALQKLAPRLDSAEPDLSKTIATLETSSRTVVSATDRIVRMVRSLRSFARLDAAAMDWFDLNECVQSTLPLVQHEVKRPLQLETRLGELPKILCHPNQLNQVIINLVMNGVHAVRSAGRPGTVIVETRWDDPRSLAILSVRDDGVGIRPEHLDRIFDPGFTTKGVGVGTGLGLSIVYRIVGDHGGRMWVDSTWGEGTEAIVELPREAKAPGRLTEPAGPRKEPRSAS